MTDGHPERACEQRGSGILRSVRSTTTTVRFSYDIDADGLHPIKSREELEMKTPCNGECGAPLGT